EQHDDADAHPCVLDARHAASTRSTHRLISLFAEHRMASPFPFSPGTLELIRLALEEDLSGGDITTDAIFTADEETQGAFVAKQELTVCGLAIVEQVYQMVDPEIRCEWYVADGDRIGKGTFGVSHGRARSLL